MIIAFAVNPWRCHLLVAGAEWRAEPQPSAMVAEPARLLGPHGASAR